MIAVPSVSVVQEYWQEYWQKSATTQAVLHGYFLYSATDHKFPEYMAGDGIGDLDAWVRPHCRMFLFQAPPEGWIKHAAQTRDTWAKFVRTVYGPDVADQIVNLGSSTVVTFDGKQSSLTDLFGGCGDQYISRDLVAEVLKAFGLKPTAHPCFILFVDLYDTKFKRVGLDDLLNTDQGVLRKALKRWFDGREFESLLKWARNA